MTTAPTPSELLALRAGATQQIRLREKFGPEGLDLKLDPAIVIRLLDRIQDLEGKVGRFHGMPLPLIEAINAATGSNDWQGEHSPAELLGPACRAIAELVERKNASIHKLEMDALDLASENSILKRAETDELEALKPLPPARVDELMAEAGYLGASAESRADFINGIRHGEVAHGITGGLS